MFRACVAMFAFAVLYLTQHMNKEATGRLPEPHVSHRLRAYRRPIHAPAEDTDGVVDCTNGMGSIMDLVTSPARVHTHGVANKEAHVP